MERYFLKLAEGNQYFEEVDKFTYDNYRSALADTAEEKPRYLLNNWVIIKDGKVSMQLVDAPLRDIGILQRVLSTVDATIVGIANGTARADGGFVREPEVIKFRIRKSLKMRHLKEGRMWREDAA